MVKSLTVFKASAGSGKTFRLAIEYIKLLVNNPQSYRSILAVTFTNKATEEMKMRILSQLYGLSKQLPDSKSYMERICEELNVTPDYVSDRAALALQNLLHNYNYFRVETIDTFFQSVLRNLARELDLAPNLRIGLNDNQVEEIAVDQLIEDLQSTDVILSWILNYIVENISDDRSWNVISQIRLFGRTIFSDDYKAVSNELRVCLNEPGFFERYTKNLRAIMESAKKRMSDIGNTFFEILRDEGLSPDDLAGRSRGISSFFAKLQKGVFEPSTENATVNSCLGDPTKWYSKTSTHREQIHMLADGQLGQLLRQAVDERRRQWKLSQSAKLTLAHLNQLRLLDSIEDRVRSLNEESNRFLLSDTQQLLNTLIGDSDSPFIFEKIGTQLEHIMIDEFQDTSTVQWKNFKVLLDETMSHNDSHNLIVGDVKQSIYRWRSGDWRLLNNIDSQFPTGTIEEKPLDTNYRSLRRIIEFNNNFFCEAAKWEHRELQDNPEVNDLERAYSSVHQLIPDSRDNSGYVSIDLLPSANYQQVTLERLVSIVRQLLENRIKPGDIAILLRNNKQITTIANYLTEELNGEVPIVSDEAFRLDASLSVNIIINAFRLLVNPADTLAAAFLQKTTGRLLPDDSESLKRLPLNELAERFFTFYNLQALDSQSAYICAFYDCLNEYTTDNSCDIADFLHEWDETLSSKTIQSDELSGIRLLSIHKSKGLEFDNVICPYCDWLLEKQSGNTIWCNPSEEPFSDLPIVPVDFSQKGMTGTIYEGDYHHEHLQNVVDNLNLLYVAFTRAGKQLFVIGKRGSKSSRSAVIEAVLPNIDGTLQGQEDKDAVLHYEYGESLSNQSNQTTPSTQTTSKNVFLQVPSTHHFTIQSFNSNIDFRQSNQSKLFISGDDDQQQTGYIKTGNVLHHVFSTIRTTDDIESALQQLQRDGVLYDEEVSRDRLVAMLRKRLEHPKVADWFSNRWQLFNECTILTVVDGEVQERRPDRVMTDGNQWIVVDFKFGSERPEYHDQVRQYMDLLRQMGHTNVSGYLWFVYNNKIVEV